MSKLIKYSPAVDKTPHQYHLQINKQENSSHLKVKEVTKHKGGRSKGLHCKSLASVKPRPDISFMTGRISAGAKPMLNIYDRTKNEMYSAVLTKQKKRNGIITAFHTLCLCQHSAMSRSTQSEHKVKYLLNSYQQSNIIAELLYTRYCIWRTHIIL